MNVERMHKLGLGPFVVVVVVVAGVALSGCGPIEQKVPSSSTINVPGVGVLGGNPLLPEQAFPSDIVGQALAQAVQQSFDTTGYQKDAVSSLKMTAMTLTVTEPDEGGQQVRGLGFLSSLSVSLGVPDGDTVLCAESADGAFDEPARGPKSYDMPMTNNELAEVFKAADTLEMTADVVPGDPPTFDTEVDIAVELTVQISPFGA